MMLKAEESKKSSKLEKLRNKREQKLRKQLGNKCQNPECGATASLAPIFEELVGVKRGKEEWRLVLLCENCYKNWKS
jgi:5-methylcytosine-specific restriction endonuclease McrA